MSNALLVYLVGVAISFGAMCVWKGEDGKGIGFFGGLFGALGSWIVVGAMLFEALQTICDAVKE